MDEAFVSLLRESVSPGDVQPLLRALEQGPETSIRINRAKPFSPSWSCTPVSWCEQGFYLSERPSFTLDPLFHAGCYYVQEATTMFLWQIRTLLEDLGSARGRPLRVLDACAAPGGKTTLLADLLPPDALLVANETIRSRLGVLALNCSKWGRPAVICNNDPDDFSALPRWFDLVLADVPCSGESMFRKNPAAREEWSKARVELCARRQRRIMARCWETLAPGGLFVYTTCTFNHFEDEDQAGWIARQYGAERLIMRKFLPHRDRGEGGFIAVFRKAPGPLEPIRDTGSRNAIETFFGKKEKRPPFACLDASYEIYKRCGRIKAYKSAHLSDMLFLQKHWRIFHSGLPVAEEKGGDYLPSQDLATAVDLKKECFPCLNLDKAQALRYLRKESLEAREQLPRTYALVCYRGYALGFVKNTDRRCNNLYPAARRILL